jgi:hypothetical protein
MWSNKVMWMAMETFPERRPVAQQLRFCNETAVDSRRKQELLLGDGVVDLEHSKMVHSVAIPPKWNKMANVSMSIGKGSLTISLIPRMIKLDHGCGILTCTTNGCPYSTRFHRVEQDLELCRRVYGVNEHMIDQTNEWSDGWNVVKDERILSMVGTVDPWTELAVPTAIVVPGASHHFWTHTPRILILPQSAMPGQSSRNMC